MLFRCGNIINNLIHCALNGFDKLLCRRLSCLDLFEQRGDGTDGALAVRLEALALGFAADEGVRDEAGRAGADEDGRVLF